jgi:hypothetical protein
VLPVCLAAAAGVLLVLNGFTMVHKEGFRPANLLSLLAGLGLIGACGPTRRWTGAASPIRS